MLVEYFDVSWSQLAQRITYNSVGLVVMLEVTQLDLCTNIYLSTLTI